MNIVGGGGGGGQKSFSNTLIDKKTEFCWWKLFFSLFEIHVDIVYIEIKLSFSFDMFKIKLK